MSNRFRHFLQQNFAHGIWKHPWLYLSCITLYSLWIEKDICKIVICHEHTVQIISAARNHDFEKRKETINAGFQTSLFLHISPFNDLRLYIFTKEVTDLTVSAYGFDIEKE